MYDAEHIKQVLLCVFVGILLEVGSMGLEPDAYPTVLLAYKTYKILTVLASTLITQLFLTDT